MLPSVLIFALSGVLLNSSLTGEPAWMKDYSSARKRGMTEKKPLMVVIGSGESGWKKVSRNGEWTKETRRVLAQKYVCVYVDTKQKKGQALAAEFEIADGPGIVISDSTGGLQAFRHEGDLTNESLDKYIKRFSDPSREVQYTETNSRVRTSYYPPATSTGTYRSYSGGRSC